jgi:hypothetical protein
MLRANLLVILIVTLLAAINPVIAQQMHLPPAITQSQGMGNVPVTPGDETQRKQAMAANLQRQAEMRRDGEKLAQLTQELNDYLQNKGQGVISVDALKKAEQIEKLAHSVKSKMKQSF